MRPRFLYFLFISFLFFSMLPEDSRSQTSGNFAHLVTLQHSCNYECGYIEFALNGDPNNYTYYWLHGPTTLILECVDPGEYTLVVIDLYGCVETYTVEVIRYTLCTMFYELYPTFNPCVWIIRITVLDGSGVPIPESALDIQWADGDPSGLTRFVTRDHTEEYCVSISALPSGEPGSQSCCEMEECILVTSYPKCSSKNRREVIVNELNRSGSVEEQFVELLVIGDGECEDSFDLRGFIVDDNNGYLIPGNDFLSEINAFGIGINQGYLIFANHQNWEKVPNGSLVVIHSGRIPDNGAIPPDDPYDSNQDGVYVLSAANSELFWAKNGMWNNQEQHYEYNGYLVPPSWELLKPDPHADGMQVRYSDGSFSHGISIGKTAFSDNNDFFLWLSEMAPALYNLSFTGTDYLDKGHFTWNTLTNSSQTPGLPNSTENATFIDSIRNCTHIGLSHPQPDFGKKGERTPAVLAYPNPFTNEIELSFEAFTQGEASVVIHSVSGREMYRETWKCSKGGNIHTLKTADALPPGLHLIKFTFPSHETETLRVVRIR